MVTPAIKNRPEVAVLLCTYNGREFLDEQLESIGNQQRVFVRTYVSDDGSADGTLELLASYRDRWGDDSLNILNGPGQGYVANFLSLVCTSIDASYFAYADQDDIWDPDKLFRAVTALAQLNPDQPALYCSRTRLISSSGVPHGLSPLFAKPTAFSNALIHNVGGGNTMVMNWSAMALLRAAGPADAIGHDWWTYMLVAGAGGRVIYDVHPSVLYRQHDQNLIGSCMNLRARWARFFYALQGRNREWNQRNTDALQRVRHLLSQENRRILDEFCSARNARLVPRLIGLRRCGVYTQSRLGNLALCTASLLKKV